MSEMEAMKTDFNDIKKVAKVSKRVDMAEKELSAIRTLLETLQKKVRTETQSGRRGFV